MTYAKPLFSRSDVRRAGEILARSMERDAITWAVGVMSNWRGAHGYPMNTFQMTLRDKLASVAGEVVVGQRLKRAPSIIAKLSRFPTMQLQQMQDIAGLRAIVTTMPKLRKLHDNYLNSRFAHELAKTNDYVDYPKADGYRSIHLVYKYRNARVEEYDGLHVELQLRTKLQHAWATAVETVDTYVGEAIKAGRPGEDWARFFELASAAFADFERSPRPAKLIDLTASRLRLQLKDAERTLSVLLRLRGFRVATREIGGRPKGSYHLIVLNTQDRVLSISSFPLSEQADALKAYAVVEEQARAGEPLDPVLVTGGTVESLSKSFPNYFLDTDYFVNQLERAIRPPTKGLFRSNFKGNFRG